jgi:hypothetical protein
MGPPFGVIGPYSAQNNVMILNHDFVHRTHMDIFQGNYYPPELPDWWMDNWISMTYGHMRTRQAKRIEILHHTDTHGRRYDVDKQNEDFLDKLVEAGRHRILEWMKQQKMSEIEMMRFNQSRFDNFPLEDIQ